MYDRRQIWCDQNSTKSSGKSELQSRFVGLLINASTETFCVLALKGKFRFQQKYLGFNPENQDISENDICHSTDFFDIGGKRHCNGVICVTLYFSEEQIPI